MQTLVLKKIKYLYTLVGDDAEKTNISNDILTLKHWFLIYFLLDPIFVVKKKLSDKALLKLHSYVCKGYRLNLQTLKIKQLCSIIFKILLFYCLSVF